MTQTMLKVRNSLFAAAVTLALGFGAAEAFATTQPTGSQPSGTCSDSRCEAACGEFGGSFNYKYRVCYCCG